MDQMTTEIINALANRINVLEREVRGDGESVEEEYGMSYDFAIAFNKANETIARLEEIIDEKDEQIEELMHKVELYASRRICGVWSL